MRFHYLETMTNHEFLIPLAQAAEKNGYAGAMVPDSFFYPRESDSPYFYNDDGGRQFLEGKEFIEPYVLSMALAVATTTLEISAFVVKLPMRPPVYSAKLATSVAVMSGNRFNFGVGLSVWREDFEYMGVPFEKRGRRFDECIDIVRGLATGEYFEYHGEFYDFPAIQLCPVPSKPMPILCGGHVDPALRRAAEKCDGWMHAGGSLGAELDDILDKLHRYRAASARSSEPFRIFVFANEVEELNDDLVKSFEDRGVTDIVVRFRNLYTVGPDRQSFDEKMDRLKMVSDDYIAKYA